MSGMLQVLQMCSISGEDGSKTNALFDAINRSLASEQISWKNCVSLVVDNTNTYIGKYSSLYSIFQRVSQKTFYPIFRGSSPLN